MKTLRELLKKFDACSPAIDWAEDKTIEQVVKECHRGDWLLEMANKLQLPKRKLISCAGHCANTVRHLVRYEKSIKLLDMCMNFEDESISFEELGKAREAAKAAFACNTAADYAAVYAARAGSADYAAVSCESATARAVYCAAARADARKQNQLQTANIVRERLGQDIINKVNQLLNN